MVLQESCALQAPWNVAEKTGQHKRWVIKGCNILLRFRMKIPAKQCPEKSDDSSVPRPFTTSGSSLWESRCNLFKSIEALCSSRASGPKEWVLGGSDRADVLSANWIVISRHYFNNFIDVGVFTASFMICFSFPAQMGPVILHPIAQSRTLRPREGGGTLGSPCSQLVEAGVSALCAKSRSLALTVSQLEGSCLL